MKAEAKDIQKTAIAHPAEAIQWGMNVAKKFIWKNMSTTQKARYMLRKALTSMVNQ